jgi:hypothetical protein
MDAGRLECAAGAGSRPQPLHAPRIPGALHDSGSATADTGWQPQFLTSGTTMSWAACPLYLKSHSYGEYVFDWAWANAYEQHGLAYYPKALVAVPFTPVPGARLLARDEPARAALVQALLQHAEQQLSSLHLLFAQPTRHPACEDAGMMLRQTVQFHWTNQPGTRTSTLSGQPAAGQAQEDPPGAAQGGEAGVRFRHARAPTSRPPTGIFLPLLRTHLPGTRQRALPDTRLFPAVAATSRSTGCCSWRNATAVRSPAAWWASTRAEGGLWPLLGRPGAGGLPALRGLLLPAAGLVHRARFPALRRRRPGRTQDGPRPAAGTRTTAPTGWPTRRLPMRSNAFWNARAFMDCFTRQGLK